MSLHFPGAWGLFIPGLDSFIAVTEIEVQICFLGALQNTVTECHGAILLQITNAYFYNRGCAHEMLMI
jgi:hypothetical protein